MTSHRLAQSGDRDRFEGPSRHERRHVLTAQYGIAVPSKAPHLASLQCLVKRGEANVEQDLGVGSPAIGGLHTARLWLDAREVVRRRIGTRSDQDARSCRWWRLGRLRWISNWRRQAGQWRRRRWWRDWDRRWKLRDRRWRRTRRRRRHISVSGRSHPLGRWGSAHRRCAPSRRSPSRVVHER